MITFFMVFALTAAVATAAVINVPEERQLCIDHCTPGVENNGCLPSQFCISNNGCGHSCHYILPGKRAMCLGAICNVYCPYGNKLNADGCPICGCNPGPVDV